MSKIKKINWPKLLALIALMQAIGFLSSFLAGDIKSVYEQLTQPPLSPPGWVFGVVWPILYVLIAIAAYLIHNSADARKSNALFWFYVQLLLNFSWTIIFFRFELYWASVAVIILLVILAGYTAVLFGRINKHAGALMVPYILWLLFATYLNIGVAILN